MRHLLIIGLVVLSAAALYADRAAAGLRDDQELIIRDYDALLDFLQEQAEHWKESDPEASERLMDAIDFAREKEIKDKMYNITLLIEGESWFQVQDQSQDVNAYLKKLEQLLLGQSKEISLEQAEGIYGELTKLKEDMANVREMTGDVLRLNELIKAMNDLDAMAEGQKELMDQTAALSENELRLGEAMSLARKAMEKQAGINVQLGRMNARMKAPNESQIADMKAAQERAAEPAKKLENCLRDLMKSYSSNNVTEAAEAAAEAVEEQETALKKMTAADTAAAEKEGEKAIKALQKAMDELQLKYEIN
jgi:hypothetical protein